MSMQAEDYIEIDQRSDGLRQFVALRAYVALEEATVKPVLLIDEAETHLHYDAQADLVQVLEEQDDVAKVVYTTHSAGCLPRDLGTGIRAIVPTYRESDGERSQTDDSEVVNRFWTHGRGFSPILIAMGASVLAFASTRKAVIAEGMSDAMLLPTLIREATGADHLEYQVAPTLLKHPPRTLPTWTLWPRALPTSPMAIAEDAITRRSSRRTVCSTSRFGTSVVRRAGYPLRTC